LADAHSRAVHAAQKAVGVACAVASTQARCPSTIAYGSRFVPDREATATWVASLRSTLARPQGAPSNAKVIAFHEAFSIYTLQLLLWATGVRPTARGLDALVPVNGLVFVDEKRKDVDSVRMLPLVGTALRQWRFYEQHRRFVIDRFGLGGAPTWFTVALGPGGRGTWQALDVARLRARSLSPLKDNGHRHAMATHLQASGWTSDRINLVMGHASVGDESGAPHCAQAVRLTDAELADIERALHAHGWRAMKGMGCG
jgi:hypothetical protein